MGKKSDDTATFDVMTEMLDTAFDHYINGDLESASVLLSALSTRSLKFCNTLRRREAYIIRTQTKKEH